MSDHSQRKEELLLAGLFSYGQKAWAEVGPFLKDEFFKHRVTRAIFRICKQTLDAGKELDYMVVAERIVSLGMHFDNLDITSYLETLIEMPISMDGTISSGKSVVHAGVRRIIYDNTKKVMDILKSPASEEKSITEVIAECDKIYSSSVNLIETGDNEPISLTGTAEEWLAEDKSDKLYYLQTGWPIFDKIFGGLALKESYCFAGRPAHNKSTILQYLAFQTAHNEANYIDGRPLPVLALDTEMESEQQRARLISAITGVSYWDLRTDRWKHNKELFEKVNSCLGRFRSSNYDHIYVPRQSADELISILRRWIYKKVGRDNPAIIVYDYLKLSGEQLTGNKESRLEIAYKLDKFKDEIKEKTNCTLVFGAQRNRYGEDDDSSLAESDHIQKLASWVGILKKKSVDQLAQLPKAQFGTHELIPIKHREIGEDGEYFLSKVIKVNGEFKKNWINLMFDNYAMHEMNSGIDVQNYVDMNISPDNSSSKRDSSPVKNAKQQQDNGDGKKKREVPF